jgi:ABC-type sulfate/molybdate transport systems ATPase subunit
MWFLGTRANPQAEEEMAKVVLENVTKRFGKVVAVNNVSLEAEDKEFLVLLGPSGCGKTTTLRMIAGLELVDEGKVMIGDDVVNDVPPAARDIAMVFQNYALYPHMTVRDNISFGLRLHNIPAAEVKDRVADAAQMLGLQDYLKRVPKELSGGQRQRVALARAIVRKPKVFLMDEPLSNLDAKLRVQTREELIKLHQTLGVTTIYVTHDQVEAMTLGSRVAVMENGFLPRLASRARCMTILPTSSSPGSLVLLPPTSSPSTWSWPRRQPWTSRDSAYSCPPVSSRPPSPCPPAATRGASVPRTCWSKANPTCPKSPSRSMRGSRSSK